MSQRCPLNRIVALSTSTSTKPCVNRVEPSTGDLRCVLPMFNSRKIKSSVEDRVKSFVWVLEILNKNYGVINEPFFEWDFEATWSLQGKISKIPMVEQEQIYQNFLTLTIKSHIFFIILIQFWQFYFLSHKWLQNHNTIIKDHFFLNEAHGALSNP